MLNYQFLLTISRQCQAGRWREQRKRSTKITSKQENSFRNIVAEKHLSYKFPWFVRRAQWIWWKQILFPRAEWNWFWFFFSETSPCFPRLRMKFLTNNVSATMFLNVERSHTRNEKAELLFCELRAPEGFRNYIWLMVISRNEIRKQIHQRKLPEAGR